MLGCLGIHSKKRSSWVRGQGFGRLIDISTPNCPEKVPSEKGLRTACGSLGWQARRAGAGTGIVIVSRAFSDMCFVSYAVWVGKCLGEQVAQPRASLLWPCWPATCKIKHMVHSFGRSGIGVSGLQRPFSLSVKSPRSQE